MRCSPQILSTFVACLSFTALAGAQTTTTSESPSSRTSVASTGGIEDMTQTTMTSPSPTIPANSTSPSPASTAPSMDTATGKSSAPRTASNSHSQVSSQPTAPSDDSPNDASSRIRDGFYLRMTFGAGYLSMSGKGPRGRVSITGMSSDSTIAIGGTLVRGLVLAGTLRGSTATGTFKGGPFEGSSVISNDKSLPASSHADANSAEVGVLIDWYPRPALG